MATSTYKSFLMYKPTAGNSDWTKLLDTKSYPDLGGTPELLETTTQSDPSRTNIFGIQNSDSMDYNSNYDPVLYNQIKQMEGTEYDFAEWFGGTEENGVVTPTGSDGKFSFKGYPSVYVTGKGVNEVREMTVSIARTTPITFSAGA